MKTRLEFSRPRRRLLAALGALAMVPRPLSATTAYPELAWEALMPKDWDPTAGFEDVGNIGILTDGDPRAAALMQRIREAWDAAPTVAGLDGRKVRLAGYLVPIETGPDGITEFLLVPYFGACIHSPPPPANQIVHVHTVRPVDFRTMEAVWVSGTLSVERSASSMGTSGYAIRADRVVRY